MSETPGHARTQRERSAGNLTRAVSRAVSRGSALHGPRLVVVEIIAAIITVAVIQAFIVKPFGVPSISMEGTLKAGDRILANRLDSDIDRFEVVVFSHGATWADRRLPTDDRPPMAVLKSLGDVVGIGPSNTAYTVKRVIGLGGDRVSCCDSRGRVIVNGGPIDEPYVYQDHPFVPSRLTCSSLPRSSRCFPDIEVPQGQLLLLGDHRSQSADSVINCRGAPQARGCARLVPAERVIGSVAWRTWPLSAFGGVS